MSSIIEAEITYRGQAAIEQKRREGVFTRIKTPSYYKIMKDISKKNLSLWNYWELPKI